MRTVAGIATICIRLICSDRDGVTFVAQGRAAAGRCPSCGASSSTVHDRYTRRPHDLPWRGGMVRWRPARPAPTARGQHRQAAVRWLCLRPPEQLDAAEHEALGRVLAGDAEVTKGDALRQRFRAVSAERDSAGLDRWLVEARTSGLSTVGALANGIESDRAPVNAAL